ncbi:MAG TPA: carboxypeptidase regulatory-like domain-containing protein [bacterium]|nr:carboxypeptidase regulatory-like domain-containing protein [bacterium]
MRTRLVPFAAVLAASSACAGHPRASEGPAPVIDSISPNQGPRTGGTVVHIAGSHFGKKPFVTFGASNVTSFVSATDDGIDLVAPADLVGPANVTVVNDAGRAATALDAWYYTPLPARAWDGRFFAAAGDLAHANRVLVQSTNDAISGLVVELTGLSTGTIAGTITDSAGLPLEGHAVVASRVDGTFPAIAFPAGVDGRYRIDGLPPGAYRVTTAESDASDYVDQAWSGVLGESDALPVEVLAGEVSDNVDFALARGARIGGAITGDGAGLDGVGVFAVDDSGRGLQFAFALSASNGGYVLHGLAAGGYRLLAFGQMAGRPNTWWPNAYDELSATPIAVTGSALAAADFALASAGSIEGTVLESPSGSALPGVVVVAHDVDRGLDFSTSSGVDGTYALPGLPAGNYRLGAPEMGVFYAGVTTTAGATVLSLSTSQTLAGKNFLGRLDPPPPCGDPAGTGTIEGHVGGPGASDVLRAAVVASGGTLASATSGQDGNWSIPCLPPGTYSVRVAVPGTDLTRARIDGLTVSAGTTTRADAVLSTGPRLLGIVRDAATHAGVPGAVVIVREDGTGEQTVAVTGSDGAWRVDRFPSGGMYLGSYTIEVRPVVVSEFVAP